MRIPGFSMRAMGWIPREKRPGLYLKSLLLILILALSYVPVFQEAHVLTHVDSVHETHLGDGSVLRGVNSGEFNGGEVNSGEVDGEVDIDIDRACLDCLALTGLSIIFSTLAIFFRNQTRQRSPRQDEAEQRLSGSASLYPTRAPPRG